MEILASSPNRRICDFAFGYAQICSAIAPQTSHIPRTLYEVALYPLKGLKQKRR